MKIDNIKIVGTTHLMSKEEIVDIIKKESPDIIGVELCETRMQIFVYGKVQEVQKEPETLLGKIASAIKIKAQEEKIEYGSDMVSAARYALENKIPLVLLDRDVREINDLMQKIPQEEQLGFMQELANFQQRSIKESTSNINEDQVINDLKTKYPVAYEFLIHSREQFIFIQILKILLNNPKKKILIFVGRGHAKSLENQLNQ